MVEDKAYQSTPELTLERQIMDSNVPKNEREWWARNEIERLREELKETLAVARRNEIGDYIQRVEALLQQKETT